MYGPTSFLDRSAQVSDDSIGMTYTARPSVKRWQGEARVTASAPPPRPIAVSLLDQTRGDHCGAPDPVRLQQISTRSQPRGSPQKCSEGGISSPPGTFFLLGTGNSDCMGDLRFTKIQQAQSQTT